MIDVIDSIFDLGKSAIDKIWPDPIKRAEEMRKLEELKQKGNIEELNAHVKLMLGQMEVNKAEAQSNSLLATSWRPLCGIFGALSLGYAGLIYPILVWVWTLLQALGYIPMEMSPPPYIESDVLLTVVTGMLGIGGFRSFDKMKGTHTNKLK